MKAVAGQMKVALPADLSIDAEVDLVPFPTPTVLPRLNVRLPGMDRAAPRRQWLTPAHQVCPYSNATRQYRCDDHADLSLYSPRRPAGVDSLRAVCFDSIRNLCTTRCDVRSSQKSTVVLGHAAFLGICATHSRGAIGKPRRSRLSRYFCATARARLRMHGLCRRRAR